MYNMYEYFLLDMRPADVTFFDSPISGRVEAT